MTGPSMTMREIAELARVSRPTVTTWRRRPVARGRHLPFPQPREVVGGVERFDRDEVVAWLAETGRGNNPDHADDALALAVPDGVHLDDVLTLLCLRVLGVESFAGHTAATLRAAAEAVDPDDLLVRREVEALEPTDRLVAYVDALLAASYGPSDALARLDAGRLAHATAPDREVSEALVDLVGAVVGAARGHLDDGFGDVALGIDGGAVWLRLAGSFAGVSTDAGSAPGRRLRQRAAVAGHDWIDHPSGLVRLLVTMGEPTGDALDRIDEAVVGIGPRELVVVLGSAAVLCDRLAGDHERLRAQTLRGGALRLAARLPRGLWPEAHRQRLALWVLAGDSPAQRFHTADLTAGDTDLHDLAADVAGALARTEHRAYRYARASELAPVLAGEAVVPRGVRAHRWGIPDSGHLDQVNAASLVTSSPPPSYDVLVRPAPGAVVLRRRSLGELRDARRLRVRRGSRIDPDLADPRGTVRVLTADGSLDGVRLDPLVAQRTYPRATRTEAGDVVFVERPAPRARVDDQGGALVATPSRILRLGQRAPVGPHTLAAIINDASGEWETWTVPELPADQAAALDDALRRAEEHRAELERRREALDALTRGLIEGASAGTLTLDPVPEPTISAPHPR